MTISQSAVTLKILLGKLESGRYCGFVGSDSVQKG